MLGGISAASANATDSEFYAEVQRREQAARGVKTPAELISMTLTYEPDEFSDVSVNPSRGQSQPNANLNIGVRIRLLKILSGVCSLAGALGVQDRVKRLLLSPPPNRCYQGLRS